MKLKRKPFITVASQESLVRGKAHACKPSIECIADTHIKTDIEKAFDVLSIYGVSKERAGNVANGIEVLATRFGKELDMMYQENKRLQSIIKTSKDTLELILSCGDAMPITLDEVQEVIDTLRD